MRLDHYIRDTYKLTGNKAQQLIKEWYVSVNMLLIQKPAYDVSGSEDISLREEKRIHWVSRSAGKLDGFIEKIWINTWIIGANCLDVGASTWGFTQVLLERGAIHVDAVDVGTAQLHPTIRDDVRVTSYEQVDIRDFISLQWAHRYDIIVCDASFISLHDILTSILSYADNHTHIILLWKPQFEVWKLHLQPRWVPKDEKIVIKKMQEWEEFLVYNNCKISQKEKSTVIGEAGNEEWLYLIEKQ